MRMHLGYLLAVIGVSATALVAASSASAAYTPQGEWGSFSVGSQPGTFRNLASVSVAPNGDVLASETGNGTDSPGSHRYQRFNATGGFISQFGSYGSGGGLHFRDPQGIAVDSAGNTILADSGGDRIVKVSPSGAVLWEAGNIGIGAGPGRGQQGIVGPGAYTPRSAAGELDSPAGVAVGPNDEVWVVDGNYRASKFTSSGMFSMAIGASVGGVSVDVCTTTCYAASHGPTVGFGSPRDIAVDATGNVFVSDQGRDRIHKFGPVGQPLAFPTAATNESPYFLQNSAENGLAIDQSRNKLYAVVSKDWVAAFDLTTSSYLGPVGTKLQVCEPDGTTCVVDDVAARNGVVYITGDRIIRRFLDSDGSTVQPVVVPPVVTPDPQVPADTNPPVVPLVPVPVIPANPVVPPADTTAPVPKLVGPPAVTAAANGVVGVTVACAEPVGQVCRSTVTITAKLTPAQITGRRAKPKVTTVTLGTKKVSVAGGKQLVVPIALSGKNRAILTRLKSIKATVTLVVTDTAGNSRTLTRTITIKAPKPLKKPKPKS